MVAHALYVNDMQEHKTHRGLTKWKVPPKWTKLALKSKTLIPALNQPGVMENERRRSLFLSFTH